MRSLIIWLYCKHLLYLETLSSDFDNLINKPEHFSDETEHADYIDDLKMRTREHIKSIQIKIYNNLHWAFNKYYYEEHPMKYEEQLKIVTNLELYTEIYPPRDLLIFLSEAKTSLAREIEESDQNSLEYNWQNKILAQIDKVENQVKLKLGLELQDFDEGSLFSEDGDY